MLLQNLHISSVIVFGGGKPFNGVLLVPREEVKVGQASTFIDNIWDTIEEANRLLPSHSRLIKEMILVADPHKPITKTDKGTIRVADTLALYSDEIEAAYTELESTRAIVPKQANSTLRDQIREAVYRVAQRDIRDDEDVFLAGWFLSLQLLVLSHISQVWTRFMQYSFVSSLFPSWLNKIFKFPKYPTIWSIHILRYRNSLHMQRTCRRG